MKKNIEQNFWDKLSKREISLQKELGEEKNKNILLTQSNLENSRQLEIETNKNKLLMHFLACVNLEDVFKHFLGHIELNEERAEYIKALDALKDEVSPHLYDSYGRIRDEEGYSKNDPEYYKPFRGGNYESLKKQEAEYEALNLIRGNFICEEDYSSKYVEKLREMLDDEVWESHKGTIEFEIQEFTDDFNEESLEPFKYIVAFNYVTHKWELSTTSFKKVFCTFPKSHFVKALTHLQKRVYILSKKCKGVIVKEGASTFEYDSEEFRKMNLDQLNTKK
ncbi:glycosyl transferase family 2 [Bacillus atrophaeus]|uniref:glycosyl transferase family 2 n=1 Tax=Bacillus atrophaeus TaxID=1452 RepID=UPI0022823EC3|nr:glycosyl transferase family 2 [Bacillus atrophaeus]MCY9159389.1 glycosyl transferase family 2 [Bacillus atrophaeus]